MKLQSISLLVMAALGTPLLAQAADSPHSFTGNVGLVSDYAFRGVSQTDENPAIQGGFDYAHASGFYLGTWASNVTEKFLNGANLEMDFYGGYAGSAGDLGFNTGLLQYYCPGQHSGLDIGTLEAYPDRLRRHRLLGCQLQLRTAGQGHARPALRLYRGSGRPGRLR